MGSRDRSPEWERLKKVLPAFDTWLKTHDGRYQFRRWIYTGRSGSLVGVVLRHESPERPQQLIMRVSADDIDEDTAADEVRRIRHAWRSSSSNEDFRSAHLAPVVEDGVISATGRFVTFQRVAGGDLDAWRPLAERVEGDTFATTCANVTASIVGDWNPDFPRGPEMLTPAQFLRELLGDKLDPRSELIQSAARNGVTPGLHWVASSRGSRRLPNPLRLAVDDGMAGSRTLPIVRGRAHGDLNVHNILLPDEWSRYQLVDLGAFDEAAPLARDPMHLLLSVAAKWIVNRELVGRDLAEAIVPIRNHRAPERVGRFAKVSRTLHDALRDWAGTSGYGDLWAEQSLLALIAAALRFAGRQVPDTDAEAARRWFFTLAAIATSEFLDRWHADEDHFVDSGVGSAVDTPRSGTMASVECRDKSATAPARPVADRATRAAVPGPSAPFPGLRVWGDPPTVPRNWFQDRSAEVEDIERHLDDDRTRLVMMVGRETYGKTAMIHHLWERVRAGTSPLRVHGLVYLSARGFWPVTADSVITGLTAMLPKHEADQLRMPEYAPWVEKLVALLTMLAGRRVIIAVDAVEELLTGDDGDIAEIGLRDLVEYLVTRATHGVRLLLVGRREAQTVADRFPGMAYTRNLDEGLPVGYAFALLRAMEAGGQPKLGDVADHDKVRLHELTDGSPRVLELAYGVLATEGVTFTRLLEFLARPDGESTVVRLLDHACQRLSIQDRRVLQALAVYGRPVPPVAVEHLVRGVLPDLDCHAALTRLRQLRLAQSDGVCFSVPATEECDYLINRLRGDAETGAWETPEVLMHRAAAHFASDKSTRPEQLVDLRPHLMEIELKLRATDYQTAFELMEHVDDRYLRGWGTSSALTDLLEKLLQSTGIPRNLAVKAKSMLARGLMQQEDYQTAAAHLHRALGLVTGPRRRLRMIKLQQQLVEAYYQQGDLRLASQLSRSTYREAIRQRSITHAMTALAGRAMCMARQGGFSPALRRLRVACWTLKLFGTAANQVHQPTLLLDQAWIYGQRGERDRARSLLQEGKRRAAAFGDQELIGTCLLSEAQLALDEHHPDRAVVLAESASKIGVRNGNRPLCRIAMEILAMARLAQGDLDAAARAADIAQPNRGSVLGYGLVGLVAYRRGRRKDARAAFNNGYTARRYDPNESDFQFLDQYGLVACGLALLGEPSCEKTAVDVYRHARTITAARGAVERAKMLLKMFEPDADCRILERVLAAAEGEGSG